MNSRTLEFDLSPGLLIQLLEEHPLLQSIGIVRADEEILEMETNVQSIHLKIKIAKKGGEE